MRTPDEFSFDLALTHKSFDPTTISSSLSIKPSLAWKSGDPHSGSIHQISHWQGTIADGSTATEYERALRAVRSFIAQHQDFLRGFMTSGGEIELKMSFSVELATVNDFKDGPEDPTAYRLFEVTFYPEFLEGLASMGIALRLCIQA
jgi:hypothetical protein